MELDEAAYRAILTERAEPVLVADAEGTLRFVNRAASALLGWEQEALVGKPITAIVPAGMRARHQIGFRRYQATGVPRVLGRPIRVPVLCRNGAELRLELTLSTLDTASGTLFVATLREPSGARSEARPAEEARALVALRRAASALEGAGSREEVAARAVEAAQAHLGAALARVWLLDASGERLCQPPRVRRRLGPPDPLPTEVELGDQASRIAEVARTGTAYLQNHLEGEGDWSEEWRLRHRLQSAALLPLHSGARLAGILGYFSDQPISAEMAGLLGLFASLLAGELAAGDRARLEAELQQAQRVRARLVALARQATREERSEELAGEVVEAARELTGSDQGFLALLQPNEEGLQVVACAGYPSPILGYRIAPGTGAASVALAEAQTQVVANYRTFPQALPPLRQRGVQAVVVAPILDRGSAIGVLKVESKKAGRVYGAAEIALLEECADLAALGLRAARAPE